MNQTQTVSRALDILFVLAESGTTLTVSEIAEKVPLPESTAYRLIKTLEINGVVERKAKGQISLGIRLNDLAKTLQQQMNRDLLAIARPVMERLTEELNETSLLVVRRGNIGLTVQYVEGGRLIGIVVKNGKTHPLHKGASGKSILAFEHQRTIEKNLAELDASEQKKVMKDLKLIKEKGFSKTVAEVDPETFAAAAPIFELEGRVVASLSIVGPKARFDENLTTLTIEKVTKAANVITQEINGLSTMLI